MSETKTLSVIIPAYKERKRIGRTLMEIKAYVEKKKISYEVLIVVDGSPDDTVEIARSYADQISHLRVIENKENHGKGAVVRQGLLLAEGTYCVFLDADGSTAITHMDTAFALLKDGADVVVGSRDIEGAYIQVHQPRHKEFMGSMGNWLIRSVLGLWDFPDTQCGFKALTREAAQDVASRMVVDRFGFDFELIVLAQKCGYNVVQMPVRWLNEVGSTVGGLFGPNGYIQVIIDLFKTRYRLWTGAYHIITKKYI